jgi:hypothetical protein
MHGVFNVLTWSILHFVALWGKKEEKKDNYWCGINKKDLQTQTSACC